MKLFALALVMLSVQSSAQAAHCDLTITQSDATQVNEVVLKVADVKMGKAQRYEIASVRFDRKFEGYFIMNSVQTSAAEGNEDYVKILGLENVACKDQKLVNAKADAGIDAYEGVSTTCQIDEAGIMELTTSLNLKCYY